MKEAKNCLKKPKMALKGLKRGDLGDFEQKSTKM